MQTSKPAQKKRSLKQKMLTVKIFRKIFAVFAALFISLGWLTGPSTENPIQFKDSENVRLSCAAVSDVHVLGASITEFRF